MSWSFIRQWKVALVALLAVGVGSFALLRPRYSYDDCVLDHVKGGMSEMTAAVVVHACRKYDRTTVRQSTPAAIVEYLDGPSLANLRASASMGIADGVATLEVTNDGDREVTDLRVRFLWEDVPTTRRPNPFASLFAESSPVFALRDIHLHVQPRATARATFPVPDPQERPWKWEVVEARAVAATARPKQ